MINRKYYRQDIRFSQEDEKSAPFPPSYYEVEKNAKAKLAKMMNPPKILKRQ